jgi:hypothetical protein
MLSSTPSSAIGKIAVLQLEGLIYPGKIPSRLDLLAAKNQKPLSSDKMARRQVVIFSPAPRISADRGQQK